MGEYDSLEICLPNFDKNWERRLIGQFYFDELRISKKIFFEMNSPSVSKVNVDVSWKANIDISKIFNYWGGVGI